MQRRDDERARVLLDTLLEGRIGPDLAARAAAGLDLPERGRYAVVVLRADRREPVHAPSAAAGMRLVWRERTDRRTAVVALGDRSPADLAAMLVERCAGPGGISPVVDGPAELGRARRLADVALLTCEPGAVAIVRLEERLPAALVVSQPELAARLVEDVFGPLLALGPDDLALLVRTLDAWLECGGSAGRAAARLYCHRNTVFNRLRRLERLTSRSLSQPRDLVEMMLALDAFRLSVPPP